MKQAVIPLAIIFAIGTAAAQAALRTCPPVITFLGNSEILLSHSRRRRSIFISSLIDYPAQESGAMTPQNRSKRRLTFPAQSGHILERIRIITRELENIQAEIYGRVSEGEPAENAWLVDDDASARVLGQFRAALDHVRYMLWLCTEAAGPGGAKAHGMQRDRQWAQASALLRALAPSRLGPSSSMAASSSPSPMREPAAQDAVSFFDRLDRVIDNYVEGGGALVEPRPRRQPKP